MPVEFFGEYLIKRGVITREVLNAALKSQAEEGRPLFATAIDKGYLSREQLAAIDSSCPLHSGDGLSVKFYDDDTRALDKLKVGATLSEAGLLLAEALARRGDVNLADLARLVRDYKRDTLERNTQFRTYQHMREATLPATLPFKKPVSFLLQMAIQACHTYTGQPATLGTMREDGAPDDEIEYFFVQELVGPTSFYFVLGLAEGVAKQIASRILGQACGEIDELALDAVSEFTNMIVGNALRQMSLANAQFDAKPPNVTTRTSLDAFMPRRNVVFPAKAEAGKMAVIFYFP